jgi:hypothetical protein
MGGESRTINEISVPIRSDVSGFSRGLKAARKDAGEFSRDTTRSFALMGHGISESLEKATGKLKALGATNLGVVTKGLAGLGVAAVGAAAALATVGFRHVGDLGKDAQALGTSAEALSRLRGVARATGVDVKDLDEFIAGLTGAIHDGIGKTTTATQAFAALGTSAEALSRLTPDEQIKRLNKGFAALPDEAAKARVALLLAGQSGLKTFRLLASGTKEFHEAFDAAPVVTDEDVSEVRKLQVALDKIADTVQHLADLFATTLAPRIAQVADTISAFANKFGGVLGVKVPTAPAPAAVPRPATSNAPAPSPATAPAAKADADLEAKAAAARARAEALQRRFDKQAEDLARNPGRTVGKPTTNGHWRVEQSNQKAIDEHGRTGAALGEAQAEATRLGNSAKSASQAVADAARANSKLLSAVADLRQENRQAIESAGKDEIHRRVDQIKGLSPDERKSLIQQSYQAREANRTSSLRDELQESTKLPVQKLGEDLARINRMVSLGAANGGLTRAQGIRAAAQKTQESGVAGGEPRFAGALQANSVEGRSYLLSQVHRQAEDPVTIARQGLALTGQGNVLLARIADGINKQRADIMVDF